MLLTPNILTIAGSDSGAGAGIQADLKTFMALGCYGICVITSLTAQNGNEVAGIAAPDPDFVALQLKTVLRGFRIYAAKTGMLYSKEIIEFIAPILKQQKFPLVVDPVCVSQSGALLLKTDAIDSLKNLIIPECELLTPNIPEAEKLSGIKITNQNDICEAGKKLLNLGPKAILIKGGHLPAEIFNKDFLIKPDMAVKEFIQPHVDTVNNHGTGCTLSAAIAAFLGEGLPLEVAISKAQQYLNKALRKSYNPGKGHGPVNHAANITQQDN